MNIDLGKTQKYLEWMKTKMFLDVNSIKASKRKVYRGNVYWCNFGFNVGSEMSKETPRPCVVLQKNQYNEASSNIIVAPITHSKNTLSCLITISPKYDSLHNNILDGKVNISNMICISKARLGSFICELTPKEMNEIDNAILRQLDLKNYCFTYMNKYNKSKKYINKTNKELFRLRSVLQELKDELNIKTEKELIKYIKNIDKA